MSKEPPVKHARCDTSPSTSKAIRSEFSPQTVCMSEDFKQMIKGLREAYSECLAAAESEVADTQSL